MHSLVSELTLLKAPSLADSTRTSDGGGGGGGDVDLGREVVEEERVLTGYEVSPAPVSPDAIPHLPDALPATSPSHLQASPCDTTKSSSGLSTVKKWLSTKKKNKVPASNKPDKSHPQCRPQLPTGRNAMNKEPSTIAEAKREPVSPPR